MAFDSADSVETAFLQQRIEEFELAMRMQKSATINLLTTLQVLIQEEEYDEALALLQELLD